MRKILEQLLFRPASELPVLLVQCISITSIATKLGKLSERDFTPKSQSRIQAGIELTTPQCQSIPRDAVCRLLIPKSRDVKA